MPAARSGDARMMARSLALLGVFGPLVALVWLALPTHDHVPLAGAVACVALPWAVAPLLFAHRLDDAPPWVFQGILAGTTLLITPGVYWTADPDSTFAFFYVWTTPYAYCWFSLRHGALQTLLAGCCYFAAVSLSHQSDEQAGQQLASALLLVATIVVVGLFARWFVRTLRRHDRLRADRARKLAEFGRASLDATDLPWVLDEALRIATHELGADFAVIAEVTAVEDELRVIAVAGPDDHDDVLASGDRLPGRGRSLLATAIAADEPIVTEDLPSDPRVDLAPSLDRFGVRSGIGVAVRARTGQRLGMGVYSSKPGRYTPRDASFADALANVVAAAAGRFAAEEELRRQALHDPLTGLPNRTLLADRLQRAMLRTQRSDGQQVAVMVIDLDRFKNVNDSLGHAFGDRLLLALSRRLSEAVRASDTLARLGGDEFVVVAEGVRGVAHAAEIADRVTGAWQEPLDVGGRLLHVQASAGVAVSVAGITADELLANADAAMYRAKALRSGSVEVYDDGLRRSVSRDLRLEQELRAAIDGDQLSVHFQPIVDPATLACSELEALVRWEHPERGLVGPGAFIRLAEETGLIVGLGERVLDLVLEQLAGWRATGLTDVRVSVNVSVRQLRDPGFVDLVFERLEHYGVRADALSIELTEHVVFDPHGPGAVAARELSDRGVSLLLDDFGTGYSSLSSLRALPVRALKIDRSFIAGLGTDPADTGIVSGVLHLARGAGLGVIAEGVETEEQARLLREMGCSRAQGFFYARPLAAAEAAAFLLASGRGAAETR